MDEIIVNFRVFGPVSCLYCKQKIKISVNPIAITRNPCSSMASVKSVFHPIVSRAQRDKGVKFMLKP